jgi:hypothetical protein
VNVASERASPIEPLSLLLDHTLTVAHIRDPAFGLFDLIDVSAALSAHKSS